MLPELPITTYPANYRCQECISKDHTERGSGARQSEVAIGAHPQVLDTSKRYRISSGIGSAPV
jgi:hypothetical protein